MSRKVKQAEIKSAAFKSEAFYFKRID